MARLVLLGWTSHKQDKMLKDDYKSCLLEILISFVLGEIRGYVVLATCTFGCVLFINGALASIVKFVV